MIAKQQSLCFEDAALRTGVTDSANVIYQLYFYAGEELDTLFLIEEHIKKKIGPVRSEINYSQRTLL